MNTYHIFRRTIPGHTPPRPHEVECDLVTFQEGCIAFYEGETLRHAIPVDQVYVVKIAYPGEHNGTSQPPTT